MSSELATRTHRKLNDEMVKRAKELSGMGLPNKSIAAGLGVSYAQLCEWLANARRGNATELETALSEAMREGALAGEATLVDRLHRQAETDIKANTWLLSHSPKWRETWSDAAHARREVGKTVDMFVAALNEDQSLTVEQRERVLLAVRAKGVAIVSADLPEE